MKKILILFLLFTSFILFKGCSASADISKLSQFSAQQTNLIISGSSDTPMRVLSIYNKLDSLLLRTKCEDVIPDTTDPILKNLINRMYATVNDSMTAGVGIAAPQVGILKNIIWVQRYDKQGEPFEVYLNPKIKKYSDQKLKWVEGCLSIPGMKDTTSSRSYTILIEYTKPGNSKEVEMVEGFTAIIFQHEIDHLNGILYPDRK